MGLICSSDTQETNVIHVEPFGHNDGQSSNYHYNIPVDYVARNQRYNTWSQNNSPHTERYPLQDTPHHREPGTSRQRDVTTSRLTDGIGDIGKHCKSAVVCAIDIGTTYTSYALSYRNEYVANPLNIHCRLWTSGHGQWEKTPTVALFDSSMSLLSFGFDALEEYAGVIGRKRKNVSGTPTVTPSNRNDTISALEVLTKILRYLKEDVLERIGKTIPSARCNPPNDLVLWVLTVPSLWTDITKRFLREAGQQAGMDLDNLVLAIEPEAAAIYCRQLPPSTSFYNTNEKYEQIPWKKQTRFLVLDLGGGFIDATVYAQDGSRSLREIHPARGSCLTSASISYQFEEILVNTYGSTLVESCNNELPEAMLDLSRLFENGLHDFKLISGQENILSIKIPSSLIGKIGEYASQSVDMTENNSVIKFKVVNTSIKLSEENVECIFEQYLIATLQLIQNFTNDISKGSLDYIYTVGGYSNSNILRNYLRKNINEIPILSPLDSYLATLKGSILYGIYSGKIASRLSQYTYACAVSIQMPNEVQILNDKRILNVGSASTNTSKEELIEHDLINDSVSETTDKVKEGDTFREVANEKSTESFTKDYNEQSAVLFPLEVGMDNIHIESAPSAPVIPKGNIETLTEQFDTHNIEAQTEANNAATQSKHSRDEENIVSNLTNRELNDRNIDRDSSKGANTDTSCIKGFIVDGHDTLSKGVDQNYDADGKAVVSNDTSKDNKTRYIKTNNPSKDRGANGEAHNLESSLSESFKMINLDDNKEPDIVHEELPCHRNGLAASVVESNVSDKAERINVLKSNDDEIKNVLIKKGERVGLKLIQTEKRLGEFAGQQKISLKVYSTDSEELDQFADWALVGSSVIELPGSCDEQIDLFVKLQLRAELIIQVRNNHSNWKRDINIDTP